MSYCTSIATKGSNPEVLNESLQYWSVYVKLNQWNWLASCDNGECKE